jgi:sugar-specific transcriptional regulator TrmB
MDELITGGLQKLGLTDKEARCYLALIERSEMSVSEMARISRVNRTAAYDVIETLIEKGLCSIVPGGVKKYRALPIDQIAIEMIERNKKECLETNKQIQKAAKQLEEKLQAVYEQNKDNTDPLSYIEVIRDKYQAQKKYLQLTRECKHEILEMDKITRRLKFQKKLTPQDWEKSKKEQIQQGINVLNRGVPIRCVYEIPPDENKEAVIGEIDRFVVFGEEARVVEYIPMDAIIFDSKIVMIVLFDPIVGKRAATVQFIEHQDMVNGFKMLFESLWEKAEDFQAFRAKLKTE